MRLVMAVSKDGFIARSQNDDLKWLGKDDKALFRLLTVPDKRCVVGRRTFETLPKMSDRVFFVVSSKKRKNIKSNQDDFVHISSMEHLDDFFTEPSFRQNFTMIGGQELAKKMLHVGLIDDAILCRSPRYCFDGIPWKLQEEFDPYYKHKMTVAQIQCEYYRFKS